MTAELLGVLGVVAGFGGSAIWLAISRGNLQTRLAEIDAHLVLLAREHSQYKRHVEQQLEAQEVTIDAYDSLLGDYDGDPRNLLARLRVSAPDRRADDGGTGVSAEEGGADNGAGPALLPKPRRGLLGRLLGAGSRAVDRSRGPVDS